MTKEDCAPAPERVMVCGDEVASLAMLSDAAAGPAAVGWNTTLMVQLALAATLVPQLFVWEKLSEFVPAMAMAIEDRGAFPVFESVALIGSDAVPTSLSVKTRDVGDTTEMGAVGSTVPEPDRFTACGVALLVMFSDAVTAPAAVG